MKATRKGKDLTVRVDPATGRVRMRAKGKGKYLIIRVDPETHRALKQRALDGDTSVQQLVEGLVATYLAAKR